MRGDVIVGAARSYCGCGEAIGPATGMLSCPKCLRSAGATLAGVLSACRWRGRSDWTAAEAARLRAGEAQECRSIHEVLSGRGIQADRLGEAAALWCSFRDAAVDALAIYGREGIEEHGRRYHWRWAIHRMEWIAGRYVGRMSDEDRGLGWDAMVAAWEVIDGRL